MTDVACQLMALTLKKKDNFFRRYLINADIQIKTDILFFVVPLPQEELV